MAAVQTVSFATAQTATGSGAGTRAITPTLPSGTTTGDRVFVICGHPVTHASTPSGWTAVYKDVLCGVDDKKYISLYYRDRDSAWSMPSFQFATAVANSGHVLQSFSLRIDDSDFVWDDPTYAGPVSGDSTFVTLNFGSFTTHAGALLGVGAVSVFNLTGNSLSVSQSGASFGTNTMRCNATADPPGSSVDYEVSLLSMTAAVNTGATASITASLNNSNVRDVGGVVWEQSIKKKNSSAFFVFF